MDGGNKLGGSTPKTAPSRLVAVDDRRRTDALGEPPRRPMFIYVDRTAELPLVVTDGSQRTLARFKSPTHLAHFLSATTLDHGGTLPQSAMDHLNQLL